MPPMASVVTHKPPAAALELGIKLGPESETLVAATRPQRPRREPSILSAELAYGVSAAWSRMCEIRNTVASPFEARLEVRSFVRSKPVVDFDLRVGSAKAWNLARQRAQIPVVAGLSPTDAALWSTPTRDFTVSMSALGDFLDSSLPLIENETGGAAAAEPHSTNVYPDTPSRSTGSPVGATPDPQWKPPPRVALPLDWKGTPADKAKPMQVFQSWLPNEKIAEPGSSDTLPLRPVMVLAPIDKDHSVSLSPVAETIPSFPAITVAKARKADVRILPRENPPAENHIVVTSAATDPPAIKPLAPVTVTTPGSVKRDNLGLPEFRMQPSGAEIAARIWTKVAGFRGRKETADGGQ